MSDERYEIGYGKPPKQHQFKRGQSGNPHGRRRGSLNRQTILMRSLNDQVLEVARRLVTLGEGDNPEVVTVQEALVRGVADHALKGDRVHAKLLYQIISAAEKKELEQKQGLMKTALEYKDSCEREKVRANKLGRPPPEPLPHPDDVIVDYFTGEVRIVGLFFQEQKDAMDELLRSLDARIDRFEKAESRGIASPELFRKVRRRQLKIIRSYNDLLPPRLKRTFNESIE